MNVQQLRDAFTNSTLVAERVRGFRENRVSKIVQGNIPGPRQEGLPKVVFHLVPLEAFAKVRRIDIASAWDRLRDFGPLGFVPRDGTSRLNLDGRVNFADSDADRNPRWWSYVQAIANLNVLTRQERRIISPQYEGHLRQAVPNYLHLLQGLSVDGPSSRS
jgi:hypothetical protein